MRTRALLTIWINHPGLGYATGEQAAYVSMFEFGFV